MTTFFLIKSMTFRIDRDAWDSTSNYRLFDEFRAFMSWFGSIESQMTETEAKNAWETAAEWKKYLDDRGVDTSEYFYIDKNWLTA